MYLRDGDLMIQIVRANKVKKDINIEMSKLFVYSFYDLFSSFCKDKEKLAKAFKHIFNNDLFYVVLCDSELIGLGACSDGSSPIGFNKWKLCKYLGLKTGKIMFDYLNSIIIERDYSFEIDKECGMLEFVCVKEEYSNKKVGFTLVNHMMHDNKYVRYLAKIADNNYRAKSLFENIGFEEFDREQASNKEREDIGVNDYLYMIYQK